ncbi:MAG TPA: FlgD immunoglobulin-like domain containing protein [Candidatus Krumholzibacteria bacterium]|nr:FlgD immunoglobulin-like domain containing protein [Candidatus Krumholzibacteria bacterium]HPD70404.1 FlgD immunoglobulin-like domain containing protein [Candidatus Krumholzibacteria bacterium]HRY39896.1 FlgD immunoglobulin-like domain containing protein [Candidatus Krumholzibacteria bacterium]
MGRPYLLWLLLGLSVPSGADQGGGDPGRFIAVPAHGEVQLLWQSPGAQAWQFRVEARRAENAWTVAVRGDAAGFTALDADPRLEQGGRILYSLYELEDETWTLVTEVWATVPAAETIELVGASPNPFNPRTEIVVSVDGLGSLDLAIFDLRGRRVATLVAGELAAGVHRVGWDGRDDAGRSVPAGTYLCRLKVDAVQRSLKLTLTP